VYEPGKALAVILIERELDEAEGKLPAVV